MKKQITAAVLVGTLVLAGCSAQPSETQNSTQAVEDATTDEKDEMAVVEDEETEVTTAEIGEPITYHANAGGDFIITVDGFERSQESTNWAKEFDDIDDGYAEYYLLLTVENIDVKVDSSAPVGFGRVWLEGSDGVTVNPANVGFSYGEYGNAAGFYFFISTGQTVKIAVPYQLVDGSDGYSLVVDGTRVPLTIVEGSRSLS